MPSNCRPGRPPKRGVPPFPSSQHTILHFKPPGLVSAEHHPLAGYHQPPHHHHHLHHHQQQQQQQQHIPVSPAAAQMMMSHSVAQVRGLA